MQTGAVFNAVPNDAGGRAPIAFLIEVNRLKNSIIALKDFDERVKALGRGIIGVYGATRVVYYRPMPENRLHAAFEFIGGSATASSGGSATASSGGSAAASSGGSAAASSGGAPNDAGGRAPVAVREGSAVRSAFNPAREISENENMYLATLKNYFFKLKTSVSDPEPTYVLMCVKDDDGRPSGYFKVEWADAAAGGDIADTVTGSGNEAFVDSQRRLLARLKVIIEGIEELAGFVTLGTLEDPYGYLGDEFNAGRLASFEKLAADIKAAEASRRFRLIPELIRLLGADSVRLYSTVQSDSNSNAANPVAGVVGLWNKDSDIPTPVYQSSFIKGRRVITNGDSLYFAAMKGYDLVLDAASSPKCLVSRETRSELSNVTSYITVRLDDAMRRPVGFLQVNYVFNGDPMHAAHRRKLRRDMEILRSVAPYFTSIPLNEEFTHDAEAVIRGIQRFIELPPWLSGNDAVFQYIADTMEADMDAFGGDDRLPELPELIDHIKKFSYFVIGKRAVIAFFKWLYGAVPAHLKPLVVSAISAIYEHFTLEQGRELSIFSGDCYDTLAEWTGSRIKDIISESGSSAALCSRDPIDAGGRAHIDAGGRATVDAGGRAAIDADGRATVEILEQLLQLNCLFAARYRSEDMQRCMALLEAMNIYETEGTDFLSDLFALNPAMPENFKREIFKNFYHLISNNLLDENKVGDVLALCLSEGSRPPASAGARPDDDHGLLGRILSTAALVINRDGARNNSTVMRFTREFEALADGILVDSSDAGRPVHPNGYSLYTAALILLMINTLKNDGRLDLAAFEKYIAGPEGARPPASMGVRPPASMGSRPLASTGSRPSASTGVRLLDAVAAPHHASSEGAVIAALRDFLLSHSDDVVITDEAAAVKLMLAKLRSGRPEVVDAARDILLHMGGHISGYDSGGRAGVSRAGRADHEGRDGRVIPPALTGLPGAGFMSLLINELSSGDINYKLTIHDILYTLKAERMERHSIHAGAASGKTYITAVSSTLGFTPFDIGEKGYHLVEMIGRCRIPVFLLLKTAALDDFLAHNNGGSTPSDAGGRTPSDAGGRTPRVSLSETIKARVEAVDFEIADGLEERIIEAGRDIAALILEAPMPRHMELELVDKFVKFKEHVDTNDAGGRAPVDAGGRASVDAGGQASADAGGRASVDAGGRASVDAGGQASVDAGGRTPIDAGGRTPIDAGGRTPFERFVTIGARSTAKGEDGRLYSYAGQFLSVLDIKTPEEFLTAIKRIWASLWSAKAISYRHDIMELDPATAEIFAHENLGMGVVIQGVVEAAASGVIMTLENGGIVVSGSTGIEGGTRSEIAADKYTLDLHARVTEKVISPQPMAVLWNRTKCIFEAVEITDTARRTGQKVPDSQLRILFEIVERLKKLPIFMGLPLDIEYAVSTADTIFITQIRPRTALAQECRPEGRGRDAAADSAVMFSGLSCVPDKRLQTFTFGSARGEVVVLDVNNDGSLPDRAKMLEKLRPGAVVVAGHLDLPNLEVYLKRRPPGAIILEMCTPFAHPVLVVLEMERRGARIPIVQMPRAVEIFGGASAASNGGSGAPREIGVEVLRENFVSFYIPDADLLKKIQAVESPFVFEEQTHPSQDTQKTPAQTDIPTTQNNPATRTNPVAPTTPAAPTNPAAPSISIGIDTLKILNAGRARLEERAGRFLTDSVAIFKLDEAGRVELFKDLTILSHLRRVEIEMLLENLHGGATPSVNEGLAPSVNEGLAPGVNACATGGTPRVGEIEEETVTELYAYILQRIAGRHPAQYEMFRAAKIKPNVEARTLAGIEDKVFKAAALSGFLRDNFDREREENLWNPGILPFQMNSPVFLLDPEADSDKPCHDPSSAGFFNPWEFHIVMGAQNIMLHDQLAALVPFGARNRYLRGRVCQTPDDDGRSGSLDLGFLDNTAEVYGTLQQRRRAFARAAGVLVRMGFAPRTVVDILPRMTEDFEAAGIPMRNTLEGLSSLNAR